ncbi:MAG: protein TolR [Pseudomonadota bacterium]
MARSKRRVMGDINVVPYIDVMLVLLVIFMVTAPLLTQGVEVELPSADAEPISDELLDNNDPLVLSIDANGRMYLSVGKDEDQPIDELEVRNRARKVMNTNPAIPVLVRADHRVAYGDVVAGMVLLQSAGAKKVGFITDPPDRVADLPE